MEEARLIKKFRPKYNILMRDDKNYSFVTITGGDFPRVVITHQPKAFIGVKKVIGPFTDAKSLRTALALLRKAFPYCTCKLAHRGLCLNAELGKCPGPCCQRSLRKPSARIKSAYQRNIKAITAILSGKKISELISRKKSEIKTASQALEYERSAHLRDQVFALEQILRHKNVLRLPSDGTGKWGALEEKLRKVSRAAKRIERVEGYDISNISGTSATGAMVVFVKGAPYKNEYRKFKIRSVKGANDVAMMAEVIIRRFRHEEWPFPELIVLDGGKAQLNAVLRFLTNQTRITPRIYTNSKKTIRVNSRANLKQIRVVALAKRDEELFVENRKYPIQLKKQPRDVLHFFQRVRDEAHRFARIYHHKLRQKKYAEK